jgi:hypothetical protein
MVFAYWSHANNLAIEQLHSFGWGKDSRFSELIILGDREFPQLGLDHKLRDQGTCNKHPDPVRKTIEILNQIVAAGVIEGYAIAGAVAAIFYTEPTDTVDLDILVAFPKTNSLITLEPIVSYLAQLGYTDFENEGIVIEGIPVQLLPTTNALSEEAYQEARAENFDGVPTRIVQLEHLMATMLELGRPKDHIRLALCLEEADYDEERLTSIIERHGLQFQWLEWIENQQRGHRP